MIIWWPYPTGTGGATSTDPGIQNVLAGIDYEINGVSLVGELIRTQQVNGESKLNAPDQGGMLVAPSTIGTLEEP